MGTLLIGEDVRATRVWMAFYPTASAFPGTWECFPLSFHPLMPAPPICRTYKEAIWQVDFRKLFIDFYPPPSQEYTEGHR